MNIHEYQAKSLLERYSIRCPRGGIAYRPEEAEAFAIKVGGSEWAVKAQILAGDRANAGGVRLVTSLPEVRHEAERLLGSQLVTRQTSAAGEEVTKVYVEEAFALAAERYLAMEINRETAEIVIVGAMKGGVEFESLTRNEAALLHTLALDVIQGLDVERISEMGVRMGFGEVALGEFVRLVGRLFDAFVSLDATFIEINPLGELDTGELIVIDAKMNVDENAFFRHPDLRDLRDFDEELNRRERERHGFNYIKLDGDIGCMVNGAGLAMATMDQLKQSGGRPANFLDFPAAASTREIGDAFRLLLTDADIRVLLVNVVGGGLTRCDAVAEVIGAVWQATGRRLPLVVRFEGTNRDIAKKTLRDMGVNFREALTLEEAANVAAAMSRGESSGE